MGPFTSNGTGSVFEMVNRGKRCVSIDLKSERGRSASYPLVERADVVFEQFSPDTYKTADSEWIILVALEQKFWRHLYEEFDSRA